MRSPRRSGKWQNRGRPRTRQTPKVRSSAETLWSNSSGNSGPWPFRKRELPPELPELEPPPRPRLRRRRLRPRRGDRRAGGCRDHRPPPHHEHDPHDHRERGRRGRRGRDHHGCGAGSGPGFPPNPGTGRRPIPSPGPGRQQQTQQDGSSRRTMLKAGPEFKAMRKKDTKRRIQDTRHNMQDDCRNPLVINLLGC